MIKAVGRGRDGVNSLYFNNWSEYIYFINMLKINIKFTFLRFKIIFWFSKHQTNKSLKNHSKWLHHLLMSFVDHRATYVGGHLYLTIYFSDFIVMIVVRGRFRFRETRGQRRMRGSKSMASCNRMALVIL